MSESKKLASLIIDELGGPTKVAKLLNITPQAISRWKTYGIPKLNLRFLRLAFPNLKAWRQAKINGWL